MAVDGVYPNGVGRTDRFDFPFIERKVLPSDIHKQTQKFINNRHTKGTPGDAFPGGGVVPFIPPDESYVVVAEDDDPENTVDRIVAGNPFITLTHYKGMRIRILRDNQPQYLTRDFVWDIENGIIQILSLLPIKDETFTFQGY